MARVTSKGQITIPKQVRDRLGLEPGAEVELVVEGSSARLRKVVREDGLDRWVGALSLGERVDDFVRRMREDS